VFSASVSHLDPFKESDAVRDEGMDGKAGGGGASPRASGKGAKDQGKAKGKGTGTGTGKGKGKGKTGSGEQSTSAAGGGFELEGASGDLEPGARAVMKVRVVEAESLSGETGLHGGAGENGIVDPSLAGLPAAMKERIMRSRKAALAPSVCGLSITGRRWGRVTIRIEGEDGSVLT